MVFLFFVLLALALVLLARKRRSAQSAQDFFIASRQFGGPLLFFLAVGDIYSIGTMVGFPGGIFARGPSYGVWFLGYILLAYPVGYFIGPKIWLAGKRYGAITLADLFRGHYGSRALEQFVAASAILFLLPWGQLQFTGLASAFSGLGWSLPPFLLTLAAAGLAFGNVAISGIRASAYVAVLKDVLMLAAIVISGVAVAWQAGVGSVFKAANAHVSSHIGGDQLTFAMTTMLFQSLGFYLMPFMTQTFFTAKSADAIRRAQAFMPLYMLMYPFLILASYYALSADIRLRSPNDAFFAAVVGLLPPALVGLVAAGAALSGLVVLTSIGLAIGSLVVRNVLSGLPESRQRFGAEMAIGAYLLSSVVMTTVVPNLMLTLINTAYYGITQFLPGVAAILLDRKLRPAAVGAGLMAGQASAVGLYWAAPDLHGVNPGLIGLAVNVSIVAAVEGASRVIPFLRA